MPEKDNQLALCAGIPVKTQQLCWTLNPARQTFWNWLPAGQRGGLPWHYVLLTENVLLEWQARGARLAELLDYARLRPLADASTQGKLL